MYIELFCGFNILWFAPSGAVRSFNFHGHFNDFMHFNVMVAPKP